MANKETFLNRYYPKEVLHPLSQRYGFDPNDDQVTHFIGKAAMAVKHDEDVSAHSEENRAKQKALKSALTQVDKLAELLGNKVAFDGYIFLGDLLKHYVEDAKLSHPNPLGLVVSESAAIDTTLNLLRNRIEARLSQSKLKPGRPRKEGLQAFAGYMRLIWVDILKHPFTLDYHKGSGTTPAFEFVREMITPLVDVTDTEIISAMRYVITAQNVPKI